MPKCPACGYEYKGKRKVVRKPGRSGYLRPVRAWVV